MPSSKNTLAPAQKDRIKKREYDSGVNNINPYYQYHRSKLMYSPDPIIQLPTNNIQTLVFLTSTQVPHLPQLGTPSYSHPPTILRLLPLLFSLLFAAHFTKTVNAAKTKMMTAATAGTTTMLVRSVSVGRVYGHVAFSPITQQSGTSRLFMSM